MAYAQELRMIAAEADRREQAIVRLASAYQASEYFANGGENALSADGTILLDAEMAKKKLEEAIRAVIGLPPLEE